MPPDFSLLPPPPPPVPGYAPVPAGPLAPVPGHSPSGEGSPGTSLPVVDFAGMGQALKRRWWVPLLSGALLTGVVGWWVNPQAPGIDACGQAIKLMELTLATNS